MYEGPNVGGRENWLVSCHNAFGFIAKSTSLAISCQHSIQLAVENNHIISQVYLESASFDENCENYCGPNLPYMFYTGDIFCPQDANQVGRWTYVEFGLNGGFHNKDPPVYAESTC